MLHRLWLQGREGKLYPGSWSEWEQRGSAGHERLNVTVTVSCTVCVPGSIGVLAWSTAR